MLSPPPIAIFLYQPVGTNIHKSPDPGKAKFLSFCFPSVSAKPWQRFLGFNCAGAALWAVATGLAGYALGRQVTWVRMVTDSVGLAVTAASALFGLLLLVQYLAARRLDRGALRAGE